MTRWRFRLRLCALALGITFAAGPAAADSLGRLFMTPEERQALNDLRRDHEYGQPVQPAAPEAPVVEHVTVDGLVIRSSGRNASWINGTSIFAGDATEEGIRVVPGEGGAAVRIMLPNDLDPIELKPGQKIDVLKGRVFDVYQPGADEGAASVFEQQAPAPETRQAPGNPWPGMEGGALR